jgi:hypothetical protein
MRYLYSLGLVYYFPVPVLYPYVRYVCYGLRRTQSKVQNKADCLEPPRSRVLTASRQRLDISSRRQRLRINIHFAMFLPVPSPPLPPPPRAPANHDIPPGNRTHYAGAAAAETHKPARDFPL